MDDDPLHPKRDHEQLSLSPQKPALEQKQCPPAMHQRLHRHFCSHSITATHNDQSFLHEFQNNNTSLQQITATNEANKKEMEERLLSMITNNHGSTQKQFLAHTHQLRQIRNKFEDHAVQAERLNLELEAIKKGIATTDAKDLEQDRTIGYQRKSMNSTLLLSASLRMGTSATGGSRTPLTSWLPRSAPLPPHTNFLHPARMGKTSASSSRGWSNTH